LQIERRAFLIGATAIASSAVAAQDYKDPDLVAAEPNPPRWPARKRFPLWSGMPPGAPGTLPHQEWTMSGDVSYRQLWIRGVAVPEVNVFHPAHADGSAILAIPGGGYNFLAVQNEGLDVARFFNAKRTTVFVLSYRLPGEGWANRHLAPLQDAQRAMRMIRSRAAEFKIDPDRLGVLGFSAGGHLAADLSVSHDEHVYPESDAVDRQSARPAFTGLIYPVATLDPDATHGDSRDNLLGRDAPPELVRARSPARHVTSGAPPSFLVHAFDDGLVPIESSMRWIAASRAARVPVEAHLLAEGGHGFGLHLPRDNPGSRWADLFALWSRRHGG